MNVKQNLSILFYLKRKKATQDGKIPIYVRITIDGLRDEFSFGYKVSTDDWDDEAKRLRTSDPNHKGINKKIGQAQTDIERHFDLMQAKHGLATPQTVKESYLTPVNGADQHKQRMENLQLSESIDEMIFSYIAYCNKVEKVSKDGKKPSAEKQELLQIEKAELKKAIEKLAKKATIIFEDKNRHKTFILAVDEYLLHFMEMALAGHRSPNTLEKWIGRKRRYLDFLQHKFKAKDIELSLFEFNHLNYLTKYLITYHSVNENTAMKYAQCVKEIMDRCVANGWIAANIFNTFQCTYTPRKNDWPTMDEMQDFIHFEFSKEIYNTVRDIAVFQCFTGYAYNETWTAEPKDVYIGFDRELWITKDRQKTGTEEAVPLLPIVLQVIEKYKNHPPCLRTGRLLPVPTNEYYNRCLKEMGKEMNSTNFDNTHRFRYFFANEVTFNKGVPLKTVSKMLGHKSVKTTEIYVRANKSNIAENMQMVKNKLFAEDGSLQTGNKSTTDQFGKATGKKSGSSNSLRIAHIQSS